MPAADTPVATHAWKGAMTALDIILMSFEMLALLAQVILCILFYNHYDLDAVTYVGWALLLAAYLLGWGGRAAFGRKGAQREGESWMNTRAVVDVGVFAVMRHPLYTSFAAIALGLACLSQHPVAAALGVVTACLSYVDMIREEQRTARRLGDAYREYMERVPRLNILLGIVRLIRRRRAARSDHGEAG